MSKRTRTSPALTAAPSGAGTSATSHTSGAMTSRSPAVDGTIVPGAVITSFSVCVRAACTRTASAEETVDAASRSPPDEHPAAQASQSAVMPRRRIIVLLTYYRASAARSAPAAAGQRDIGRWHEIQRDQRREAEAADHGERERSEEHT